MSEQKDTDRKIPTNFTVVGSIFSGFIIFFAGHSVGYESAMQGRERLTFKVTIGDHAIVTYYPDGSVACGLQAPEPKRVDTSKLPDLDRWVEVTKFVIGKDGQWEQRNGKCTEADLNCMD
jgi:hypothetical protein